MRGKVYRRHQERRHMWRRLKEDRNQHYDDLTCPCWSDKKAIARFREQPQACSCVGGCGHMRLAYGRTMQELRFYAEPIEE